MKFRRAQRRRLGRIFLAGVAALLSLAAWWLQEEDTIRPRSQPPAPAAHWVELQQPELVPDPNNDGDSFRIRHQEGEHVLRLYFVDCPEKQRHHLNRARLAEQGAYFGGLMEAQVVALGREAQRFTLHELAKGGFRVFTRWEPVFNDRRFYAHVLLPQPDGSWRQLAELLVEQGLARLHTKGEDLPDGVRRAAFTQYLRQQEKKARLARRGGWAHWQEEDE